MSDVAKFEKNMTELKELLMTADDFRDIYEYFFDHMSENPEFMRLGKRAKNPALKGVIKSIGERLFREEVEVTKLFLKKIPRYSFYHGPCLINGRMAGVLFFEDIDMGIVSVLWRYETSETRFIRFSSLQNEDSQLKGRGDVIYCAPRNKTIH